MKVIPRPAPPAAIKAFSRNRRTIARPRGRFGAPLRLRLGRDFPYASIFIVGIFAMRFALLGFGWPVMIAPLALAPSAQSKPRDLAVECAKPAFAKSNPKSCAKYAAQPAAEPAKQPEQPTRPDFTADDQAAAIIPGIPDARFWADSEQDFLAALPKDPGPWLALSTGGGDGAYGAGLLSGWSESGKRPEFSVVTGVSTGSLMAPFAFIGSSQDSGLKRAYTETNAGDIFEDTKTPESLVDTWPLKRLIEREVTPELLAQVAEGYKKGRRLFVATTNLDAERGVIWNMGAIAAKGDDNALKLFRNILLASTAIPGLFPPVLIDVEANGKKTQEMHADGGLSAQVFVAPESMINSSSTTKLPATELYLDCQQPPDAGISVNRAFADLRPRSRDHGRCAIDAARQHRPHLCGGKAQRDSVFSRLPGARERSAGQGLLRFRIHEGPVPDRRRPRTRWPSVRTGCQRGAGARAGTAQIAALRATLRHATGKFSLSRTSSIL